MRLFALLTVDRGEERVKFRTYLVKWKRETYVNTATRRGDQFREDYFFLKFLVQTFRNVCRNFTFRVLIYFNLLSTIRNFNNFLFRLSITSICRIYSGSFAFSESFSHFLRATCRLYQEFQNLMNQSTILQVWSFTWHLRALENTGLFFWSHLFAKPYTFRFLKLISTLVYY